MSKSEQILYVPYKHVILVIVLAAIVIISWLYTPETLNPVQKSKTIIPLELVLSTESIAPKEESLEQNKDNLELEINSSRPDTDNENSVNVDALAVNQQQEAPPTVVTSPEKNEDKVVIRQGDILSVLFDKYDLGQTILHNILSADESLLTLETLRPGQVLYFRYKENTRYLEEMELYKHPGYRVIYRRIADDAFDYETIINDGEWRNETVNGTIEGVFYWSAQRAGLTEIETATVTEIFQEQLNFSRAIRKGDRFQIVRSVQMIDDQPTGKVRIESARIQQRRREYTAFLFSDGRYYDKQGKSLARAFTRTPLNKKYRISSSFNPRRVHPVTGRVSPHNGTDFATPTGTKVFSTGDGTVARVGNHPFAGRYVDIQHGGQYKTRYLHLHRVLVRRGETVRRGQAIALSGNTGRSTGPHLHFELHVHGRPVNPMRAKIPISRSVSKKDKPLFAKKVTEQTQLLDTAT
ncbi:MAG: murein DD-endopeptidase [Candidatus Endobugula sp.]|jgi:murein DD-endopeptidase